MSARTTSRAVVVVALLGGLLAAATTPAGATSYANRIRAVFAGVPAAPGAQFVMLQMYEPLQNQVAGKELRVFDAAGNVVTTFPFQVHALIPTAQSTILAATPSAETFFGVEADLEMHSAALPPAGGKVCLHDPAAGGFGDIDCVSWGGYSGSSVGSGSPFNPTEGIPSGATIERVITGGTDPSALDAGDDSGNSAADFRFAPAAPRNNLGTTGSAPGGVLSFGGASSSIAEAAGTAQVSVTRTGGTGTAAARATSAGGTATSGADYASVDHTATLVQGQGTQAVPVTIMDDLRVEPPETVELHLRSPSGGAVLGGVLDHRLTIVDDEPPDVAGPVTHIGRPRHGGEYRGRWLTELRGDARDVGSDVRLVEVALRQKRADGTCRWWNGDRFIPRRCGMRLFQNADGAESWTYELPHALKPSVGTNIRGYTVFARSLDSAQNLESVFAVGRNKNRFEIT